MCREPLECVLFSQTPIALCVKHLEVLLILDLLPICRVYVCARICTYMQRMHNRTLNLTTRVYYRFRVSGPRLPYPGMAITSIIVRRLRRVPPYTIKWIPRLLQSFLDALMELEKTRYDQIQLRYVVASCVLLGITLQSETACSAATSSTVN